MAGRPAGTRAERAKMPQARDLVRTVAIDHGVCIRPVPVRRIDMTTGETEVIDVPCGATFTRVCPPCAERKKRLRMAQCREGWHLDAEPILEPDPPTGEHKYLAELRADLTKTRAQAATAGQDTTELDAALEEIDEQLRRAGVRGTIDPGSKARRARSTRRRQDAPDLPRRKVEPRTVGRTYTAPDGTVFRPSMFITGTLDTYGRVRSDGTPVDPARYDYRRAARDALHFGKLIDRFVQNLRRVVGYEVQYFAAVEPQRRLAPHIHFALRGAVPRAEIRQVAAATYHQVWWPQADEPVYTEQLPVWDADAGRYTDPDSGALLPTWDEALDAIGPDDEPMHVVRFGPQVDVKGVNPNGADAARCIGYLTKYLVKSVDDCHTADSDTQRAHVDRMVEALRYEPCSPTCANWLRYGVQPKNARAQMRPGYCKAKAHKREHLGYGGRRVLVSRKWSGKTLADHKADRRAWVLATLGLTPDAPEANRYAWELTRPDDDDVQPLGRRLLHAVAERQRWRAALEDAKRRAAGDPPDELSATTPAATAA
jgi:hypothetical protein